MAASLADRNTSQVKNKEDLTSPDEDLFVISSSFFNTIGG
jgi:hypothetical protein